MPTDDEWNDAEMTAEELGAHYATPAEGKAAMEKRLAILEQRFNDTRNEKAARHLAAEIAQTHALLKEYQLQIDSQN